MACRQCEAATEDSALPPHQFDHLGLYMGVRTCETHGENKTKKAKHFKQ